ncbi:AaceriADR216Wp [[Ashbya] aceris (nom. inval.)]|nr:AaceriADR216Wp [[Ashbya] aceris (nom. inval.)]
MPEPVFQLRKELNVFASEEGCPTEDISSYAATADSSGLTEWNTSDKFTNEMMLTENAKYTVSQLAPSLSFLPEQATELTGTVDCYSGNALCNDRDTLHIWPFNSTQRRPTCIRIPLHEEHEVLSGAPLCCFTWPSAGEESEQTKSAGVLIVHANSGLVHFYEDIHTINSVSTLISKSRVIELDLRFRDREHATDVVNAEPSGILVATSFGRLLLLTIRDSSGKPCLKLRQQLIKSQVGFFSGAMNSFKDIVAIRPSLITGKGERLLHTITRGGELKIWNVSATMSSYKRIEVNVYQQILESLQELYPFAYGSLQILDLHPLPSDPFASLVLSSISDGKETYYILTAMKVEEGSFSIFSVYRLNTYTKANEKKPRLFIAGDLENVEQSVEPQHVPVYLLFEDAVVITQAFTQLDSNYPLRKKWEDLVSLKKDNRVLGHGYDEKALYLINGNSGVVRVEAKMEPAEDYRFVKSHIDQAVYFSQVPNTPVEFNLPPSIELERDEVEEDLLTSGDEILLSYSSYIPPKLHSMTSHLQLRVDFFVNLLQFTRANFIYKVSPQVKLKLLESYEILNCALALSSFLSSDTDLTTQWNRVLLSEELTEEELMLHQLNQFPPVFGKFLTELDEPLRSSSDIKFKVAAADLVNCVIYHSCLEGGESEYRSNQLNLDLTEVGDDLPWFINFSIPESLNKILLHLFYSFEDGDVPDEYHDKLLEIIKSLYYMCKQSDVWYAVKGSNAYEAGYQALTKFYTSNHLTWIQILLKIGRPVDALNIADFYHDLSGLVETLNSFDNEKAHPLYEEYFTKYGYQFSKTLFTTIIEQGKINDLFSRFPAHHDDLVRFFDEYPHYGHVSWIGNIFDQKYNAAAEVLVSVSSPDAEEKLDLNQLQVRLSIAKLSALAEEPQFNMNLLNTIQSRLDLIDSQKKAAEIVGENATISRRYLEGTATESQYQGILDKLKANIVLSEYELVGIYTILDNASAFAKTLQFLSLAKTISEDSRQFLISMTWRRCILFDDWNHTSNDLSTALYATLLIFFKEELYRDGIPLPHVAKLTAPVNKEALSEQLFAGVQCGDLLLEGTAADINALSTVQADMESRIRFLIGSAHSETDAACVVNYETNTVD